MALVAGAGRGFRAYRMLVYASSVASLLYLAAYPELAGEVARALLFLLPALAANGAPVVASSLLRRRGWRLHPIDAGRRLGGARILGDGKTWEGLVAGTLTGLVAGLLVRPLLGDPGVPSWYGAVLGLGALLGDMAGSFVKRRMGLERGHCTVVLDQLDFIAGSLLASWALLGRPRLPPGGLVVLVILVAGLHLATNHAAYLAGLKGEEC